MDRDRPDHQERQHHDVEDVQAADELAGREVATEHEVGQPRTQERDGQDDRVHDPKARSGQQIVRQRIAGDPGRQRHQQQAHADQPVDLARPAERAGEEDPTGVHDDRGQEHERRPVVDLAHQQPGAHVERQPHHRIEGRRHLRADEGRVRTRVRDRPRVGGEEEREVHARGEQHDIAEQRDLAQQERPVIREDLVQHDTRDFGGPRPLIEPADEPIKLGRSRLRPGRAGTLASGCVRREGAR